MVLLDSHFFKWVAEKYNLSSQSQSRFPILTFLILKQPPILFSPLQQNIKILPSNRNYYFKQNLLFNIMLYNRIADKSHLKIEDHLKNELVKKKGLFKLMEFFLRVEPTRFPNEIKRKESSDSRIRKGVKEEDRFFLTSYDTYEYPYLSKFANAAALSYLYFYKFIPAGLESSGGRIEKRLKEENRLLLSVDERIEKLKSAAKSANSITVFKPMIPASFFFTGSINLAAVDRNRSRRMDSQRYDNKGSAQPSLTGTASKFIPKQTLNYSNPFKVTLENLKNSVAQIEKQMQHEKNVLKNLNSDNSTVIQQGYNNHPKVNTDINELSERVYLMLEKKIRIEKERRGL